MPSGSRPLHGSSGRAIVGAREYSTGMIRTTLAAVPARLPVLWGKLATFVGVLAPVVLVGVLVSFFAGMAILDAGGAATVSWSDVGVTRAVIGTAVYLVGLGVIGVALGILLRGTAGGIGTVIGAVLFVPILASALLPDSWDGVLKYLPSNAGQAFTALNPGDTLLSRRRHGGLRRLGRADDRWCGPGPEATRRLTRWRRPATTTCDQICSRSDDLLPPFWEQIVRSGADLWWVRGGPVADE